MTLQPLPGLACITLPEVWPLITNGQPTLSSTATLDASLEALHFIGRVIWADRESHTISSSGGKIGWVSGSTVWSTGGSIFTIGIQDVNGANGPAGRGDGTFDTYATLTQGVETIATNTAYETALETGTKTIATGDLVAIVLEFTTVAGSDSVSILACTQQTSSNIPLVTTYTGSTYAGSSNRSPNCWLVADDGTYGIFSGTFPISTTASSTGNFNNTSTTKQYGNLFELPFNCEIFGQYVLLSDLNSTGSAELNLYTDPLNTGAGVTEVAEGFFQARSGRGTSTFALVYAHYATPYTYTAGTLMAMACRPTTATNINLGYANAFSSGMMSIYQLGQDCYSVSRNTVGSSTAFGTYGSTARRMLMGLLISKFDDGAGGGTTIAGTPMRRGMV